MAEIIDLYRFGEFSVKNRYVDEGRVKYWLHWVKRYASMAMPPGIEKLSDRIGYYINNLKCEPEMEDWRVRQAEEAVRIFETVYKPTLKKAKEEGKAGNPVPAGGQRSAITPSAQCLGVPHSLVPAGGQRSVDSPSTQRGETALASLIPLRKEAAARQDTSESQGAGMKNSSYELNYERNAKRKPGESCTEQGRCGIVEAGQRSVEEEKNTDTASVSLHSGTEAKTSATLHSEAEGRDSLERRMREILRVRNYSYHTEQSYLDRVKSYFTYAERNSLGIDDPETVRRYISWLALSREVAASTQNLAFNAINFLFKEVLKKDMGDQSDNLRARSGSKLPSVLTVDEVRAIFAQLEGTERLMLEIIYGGGLRISELMRLRVQDIDLNFTFRTVKFTGRPMFSR